MKIALLGSFPLFPYRNKVKFWNDRKDLTTTWNYNLAKALADIPNCEVHVLTNAPLLKTKTIKTENISIHFIGHLPKINYIDYLTRFRYSKFIINRMLYEIKPDLVHGSGTDHEYAYVSLKSKYPNIFTVHYVMKDLVKELNSHKLSFNSLLAKYEKISLSRSKYMISVSKHVANRFPEFNGRIFVIYNPIADLFFRQETSKESKEFDIVYVGDIIPRKGVLNLIKSVNILISYFPELSVVLIGAGFNKSYYKKVREYIIASRLEKHIKILGRREPNEIASIISKSKVFVLPSKGESFSMVCAEAQAVGIPVVAYRIGGPDEVVIDGKTGILVEPDNLNQLSKATKLLLQDSDLAKKMGKAGRTSAKERFHPHSIANKTYDAYKFVIDNWE